MVGDLKIVERWRAYCQKLFNPREGTTGPDNVPVEVEEFEKNWSEFSEGSIEQDH